MENNKVKILIVDDEPAVLEFMEYNLQQEGYQVFKANNGRKAIEITNEITPHIVLLDVMMPEMDGIEVCKKMRGNPNLESSIIAFLTAKGDDISEIEGFEAGADDYIHKPIKPRVLLSRIKGLLRRNEPEENNHQIILGDIIIDCEQYVVIKGETVIQMSKMEFNILKLLASKPGKVFIRSRIYQIIWGNDIIVGERTLDVHIRKLREKIGENYIKTVKGIGYKFDL